MYNSLGAKLDPEQLAELEKKFGFSYRPSASQPNDEPTSKRTAKGKSLTGVQSQAHRVPGATSAQRTRPSNPSKDKQGHRQLSKYQAKKLARNTTTSTNLSPDDPRLAPLSDEEVRDRLLNPSSKHYTTNPVITSTGTLK